MSVNPLMGEITMVAFNFPPRNWAACDGQLLPIAQYNALFSLLGTTYGGDGRTTFALPDLRGRSPVHKGQGDGLPYIKLGDYFGIESYSLTTDHLPVHSHNVAQISTNECPVSGTFVGSGTGTLKVTNDPGNSYNPKNKYLAQADNSEQNYTNSSSNLVDAAADSVSVSVSGTTEQVIPELTVNAHYTDNTGGSQPIYTRTPSCAVMFAICISGAYPSRN